MAYIAAEDILKAKEMDLMTYLRNYEPQELVHVSATPTAQENMTPFVSATGNGMVLPGHRRTICS
jgi:ribosomal protein L21E